MTLTRLAIRHITHIPHGPSRRGEYTLRDISAQQAIRRVYNRVSVALGLRRGLDIIEARSAEERTTILRAQQLTFIVLGAYLDIVQFQQFWSVTNAVSAIGATARQAHERMMHERSDLADRYRAVHLQMVAYVEDQLRA